MLARPNALTNAKTENAQCHLMNVYRQAVAHLTRLSDVLMAIVLPIRINARR